MVVGFPGLQDPLDQATLLEQLGTGGSSQVSRRHAPSAHPRAEWAQQAARGHVSPELPVGTPGIRAQPCGPHHGPRQAPPTAIHEGTHVPPSPPPLGRCLLPAASRWPPPLSLFRTEAAGLGLPCCQHFTASPAWRVCAGSQSHPHPHASSPSGRARASTPPRDVLPTEAVFAVVHVRPAGVAPQDSLLGL